MPQRPFFPKICPKKPSIEGSQNYTHPVTLAYGYRVRSFSLCYKRSGVTVQELPLKDSDLIINLESWIQIAQKNGWVVIRREELVSRMAGMIEQCMLSH